MQRASSRPAAAEQQARHANKMPAAIEERAKRVVSLGENVREHLRESDRNEYEDRGAPQQNSTQHARLPVALLRSMRLPKTKRNQGHRQPHQIRSQSVDQSGRARGAGGKPERPKWKAATACRECAAERAKS